MVLWQLAAEPCYRARVPQLDPFTLAIAGIMRRGSVQTRLLRSIGFLLLAELTVVTTQGCHCDDADPAESIAAPVSSSARREGSATLDRWSKLSGLLPTLEEMTEIPCDDKRLDTEHAGAPGRVMLVDFDYLSSFRAPYRSPYDGSGHFWQQLTHRRLRQIPPSALARGGPGFTDALLEARAVQTDADYWGVLRTSIREIPRVEGSKFHAGIVEGWLVVLEPSERKTLCQVSVSVSSSLEVSGTEGTPVDTVIQRDFSIQLRRGLDASLHRISRQLSLTYD